VPTATRSLLDLLTESLESTRSFAREHGVEIGLTVDPVLPPYVSVRRIDLPSIVTVVLRRALSVVRDTNLYLTIAEAQPGRLLLQLEDTGSVARKLGIKHWQQLVFWTEELGGEITRDEGVLLWNLALPLDAKSSADSANDLVPNQTGLRLLIASGDTDVRARLVRYARDQQQNLIECRSDERALALCKSHRFDLILLDSDLSGGGGLQLARAIRAAAPDASSIALISTAIPADTSDFTWVKFWMHKPPREHELDLALQVARNHRNSLAKPARKTK
jgi:CheY-like chemotaxis protein